jgi:Sigma-70, region 4
MVNIDAKSGRLVLTPRFDSADKVEGSLWRFGLALARDDRLVCDQRSALLLVENLGRRALLAVRNGAGRGDQRLQVFSLFIRLYRRHARLAAAEDGADETAPPSASGPAERGDCSLIKRAIRNLPLELREALLLVVLERFSHREAAEALDIPLGALIDRLRRGRAFLAAEVAQRRAPSSSRHLRDHGWRQTVSHLRLVK